MTTQAPWKTFQCVDDTRKIGIMGADGYRIAYTAGGLGSDQPIREANARLIAAAPNLLRQLEMMVDYLPRLLHQYPELALSIHADNLSAARRAIAQAKGE